MAAPTRPEPPDPASGMVRMTTEEFLEWEEQQELRYEFDGEYVRAMTGGTIRHNQIAGNIYSALRAACAGTGCRTYFADVQVRTPVGRIYYPDVQLRCGPFDMGDRHARTPCLIVEVTSPATRGEDRGGKRRDYRTIPSLQANYIVEQAARRVDCHVRQPDGAWDHLEVSDAVGVLQFAVPCVDAVLTLDQVYDDTDIAPPPDLRVPVAPA